ncbi:deleted in malignant brain tumors 1 protein-like, partial [Carassius auratus]|uniref:Deleted in malignant brain tumors 1 protein-like n=1 Tax=Carassius auratus TaxID=7957 RepID=A0A6P6MZ93_CARAU
MGKRGLTGASFSSVFEGAEERLVLCFELMKILEQKMMGSCLMLIFLCYMGQLITSDLVNMRLVDGHSRCAGRVEVLHRGQWGTVCDDFWDMADAAVVCRELDCGEPVDALGDAHFGPGSGPIWMSYVRCTGSESKLKNCGSGGWGKHYCGHNKDAGVICSGVKLVGGSRCSGRLEILHNQTWMSVCDAVFDQQDAEVVCRELDCGAPVQVLGAAAFDKGDAQMWTQEIQCRGNESQIHLCPTSPSHENNCSHNSDVGLVCAERVNVRLIGGHRHCAGRVEVLHRGQWGTVCDDSWDMADAAVVCRELDCGEPVDALSAAHFGSGSGRVWMSTLLCTGTESTLKNCGSSGWGKHYCDHSEDVGVICSGVRLVGDSRCSGRLEILHNQTWMSVCDAVFDQQDAEVVCRELDCGAPVQVLGAAAFEKGDAQMWTQEIQCRGNESQIRLCPTIHDIQCSQENSLGLICSDFETVRLVGGNSPCSGRVEVHHHGQWGTVCGNDWDETDAAVVCRELGCGEPLDALFAAHFGPGSGPIWMSYVDCSGSESTLKDCRTKGWGVHGGCYHHSDAGVICSGVRLVGGSRCSGRLEILHNQTWLSVCDAVFDQQDAEVVCRELDCGAPVQVLGAAAFDKGDAQMWTQEIQCRGNESQIHLCPTSPSHENNCSHDSDVGLICTDRVNVRLVGGHSRCAGRVEVLHRGQWGTVCDDGWDMTDAAVVCRELDCGEPVDAQFGRGSGPIWMSTLLCTGTESTLKNCGSSGWGKHGCDHNKDVGVICSGVRLVGGSHCSGRLEILHNQTWMSVCDAVFDQQDAEVVCRELDCGAPVQVLGAAAFGKGDTQMWTQEIQCRGNESFIRLCPTSHDIQCSQENNVGLICSDFETVRLVGGNSPCSGRVEVHHDGQWGTVCGWNWDMADAAVVCREMGCGDPLEAWNRASFGQGSGPVLSQVACIGSESTLKNCRSSGWDVHYCNHQYDAGVICSGTINYGRFTRLSDGPHLCSGRLEILHNQTWMSVCDAVFDQQDADVVCKSLDCGAPVQVLGAAAFGKGDTQMWTQEIQCRGYESHIQNCPSSASNNINCTHDNHLGLICSGYTDLRLVNSSDSCSGRVELQFLSKWGTACDACWDMRAASVLCGQLNCGIAVSVVGSDWFGEGSGEIWADVFD